LAFLEKKPAKTAFRHNFFEKKVDKKPLFSVPYLHGVKEPIQALYETELLSLFRLLNDSGPHCRCGRKQMAGNCNYLI
jgi:hypothetical protein